MVDRISWRIATFRELTNSGLVTLHAFEYWVIVRSGNSLHRLGANSNYQHDDVIKWKYFPRYWPFVRGIRRLPVNSPHKGQWRGALIFSLILAWINGWVNNGESGDLIRHRAHYDVTVMKNKAGVLSMGSVNNTIGRNLRRVFDL